jgi:predicted DCC family thiol-disulfide oxidoreductase YuxK
MRIQDEYDIVLFDGVCNLCNSAIDFIVRKDENNHFKVGALQDEKVQKLLEDYQIDKNYLDSIVLIRGDQVFYKSKAALEIAKKLPGFWSALYIFRFLPQKFTDFFYDVIANNRYKWYGKKETCRLPTPEERVKFLN